MPIRWRLAGGSAILTLTILLAFAAGVGVLAGRQIESDFQNQVSRAADELGDQVHVVIDTRRRTVRCAGMDLRSYGVAERAAVRVSLPDGEHLCGVASIDVLGFPRPDTALQVNGYRVESRTVPVFEDGGRRGSAIVQYGLPLSEPLHTIHHVRDLLVLGVLGGAALALLAGLAVAGRAMSPIKSLTESAREIRRTRDPGRRIAVPRGSDEVAELARTLDGMLRALDAAQGETEQALNRQRQFVADASHELRTPLTSILANLELLSDALDGEERETSEAALRSARRMRRIVADLLLLARADAGHTAPRRPVDLSEVVLAVGAELSPVAEDHLLDIAADEPAVVIGTEDELHRMALNLLSNSVAHTPPGTRIRACVRRDGDRATLIVEDDGPGIPPELAPRIFDRFVRAGNDAGGGTGLGLAIVRTVAVSHGGTVRLETPPGGGARFVVQLPAAAAVPAAEPQPASEPS